MAILNEVEREDVAEAVIGRQEQSQGPIVGPKADPLPHSLDVAEGDAAGPHRPPSLIARRRRLLLSEQIGMVLPG